MFNAADIELARNIVEKLALPDCIGYVEDDETLCDDISLALDDIIDFESDFYVTSGVSKVVIDIEKLPFVIKFPFDGMWSYDGEEEEDYFEEYCGAYSENGNNYCEAELRYTRLLEEEGYGYLVPEMDFLCVVCGRPFYIQSRVRPFEECYNKLTPTEDSLQKTRNCRGPFDLTWRALAYDFYGEEAFNGFLEWATNNAPDVISDAHGGNYGIDMAGRPVLLDISGFNH